MHLKALHAQYFRNIGFTSLDTDAPAVFFLGSNGQGKTNALEAVGMISAMRSFRTSDRSALIQRDQPEARLRYELAHEFEENCEVLLHLHPKARTAHLHGNRLPRLADLIGRFPTIALCADDIHLLRGAPGLRRKYLDMSLSINRDYLEALTRYHRALRQRNAALKAHQPDPATLTAFEHEMAPAAAYLVKARRNGIATMSAILREHYKAIASTEEQPDLLYQPHSEATQEQDFLNLWERTRKRDSILGSTQSGPQRDDFILMLKDAEAREFASEGQQRALVLALRMAQAHYSHEQSGVRPIILADDILGQLDPERQERFWNALGNTHQVIATGTVLPEKQGNEPWRVYGVKNGSFTRQG